MPYRPPSEAPALCSWKVAVRPPKIWSPYGVQHCLDLLQHLQTLRHALPVPAALVIWSSRVGLNSTFLANANRCVCSCTFQFYGWRDQSCLRTLAILVHLVQEDVRTVRLRRVRLPKLLQLTLATTIRCPPYVVPSIQRRLVHGGYALRYSFADRSLLCE